MSEQTENAVAEVKTAELVPEGAIITPEQAMNALQALDGIEVGDIGMKISRVPLEKYKASVTKIDRIGFVNTKVIAIKTHYIEDVGSILCFGKKCCEIDGMPSIRYLFPIVVYSTDNEGTVVGAKLDLKILSAGEDLYKSIITISRATAAQGGIDNVDLLVTCTDDKYQKITLNQAGPAMWKKSKQAVQYVSEQWSEKAEYAYMAVARKMEESTFLSKVGLDGGGGADQGPNQTYNAQNTNIESFFNDEG